MYQQYLSFFANFEQTAKFIINRLKMNKNSCLKLWTFAAVSFLCVGWPESGPKNRYVKATATAVNKQAIVNQETGSSSISILILFYLKMKFRIRNNLLDKKKNEKFKAENNIQQEWLSRWLMPKIIQPGFVAFPVDNRLMLRSKSNKKHKSNFIISNNHQKIESIFLHFISSFIILPGSSFCF